MKVVIKELLSINSLNFRLVNYCIFLPASDFIDMASYRENIGQIPPSCKTLPNYTFSSGRALRHPRTCALCSDVQHLSLLSLHF